MKTYRPHMERTQDSIFYIETDIPPHMTANDWRRSRAQAPRRRLIGRLRTRRGAAAAAARAA
jgi:hypothetical protein